jgi:NAD(P)-dependent dehydrogenase (short-subunit alcohol dehydrogenase family)
MRSGRRGTGPIALATLGAGLGLAGLKLMRRGREADLRGQVVLITGGSRGLGLLMAEEFARQGARLVLCARDAQELAAAEERLARGGAEVLTVPCDVADRDQVATLVGRAHVRFGRIDVLVNNASIIRVGPVAAMTLADFEEVMAINFWGAVYPTLAVLPEMRARRSGRIVNITSIGGKVAVPHLLPYDAAKFAFVGFSEGLRAEVARDGIAVVTICPGLMRTGSYVNAEFKGAKETEYALFSSMAILPLTAQDARGAAARIVRACRRGEAEVILGWQAETLARFHGLFPGLTADLFGLANRLLPTAAGPEGGATRGQALGSPPAVLRAPGEQAAREYHEYVATPPNASS